MIKQSDPILDRAKYFAAKIDDGTLLESEFLGIGAMLAAGETNIIVINLLTQIRNSICGSPEQMRKLAEATHAIMPTTKKD